MNPNLEKAMRTLCIVAAVLLLLQSATGQTFEAKSKPFKLKMNTNVQGPEIKILEPAIGDRAQWFTSNRNPPLRGLALSDAGVKSVNVNDIPANLEPNGSFSYPLKLTPGINVISVVATSANGGQSTTRLEFIYDNAPPIVELLNPPPSKNRGTVDVQKDSLELRLKVSDVGGIKSVSVNNMLMRGIDDSTYTLKVGLVEGENELRVVATDKGDRQTERIIPIRRMSPAPKVDFVKGKAYALIIGIDKYKGVWPPLENAVRDARAVEDMLRNNFVFERITPLYDEEATRSAIISALEDYGQKLKPEDRLMVYYSGHGELKEQFNTAYWVPSDATRRSTAEYISDLEIRGFLGGMLANHVLLVADACFAGDITMRGRSESVPFQNSQEYFKTVAKLKSRRALTSGAKEPVPDSGADGHTWFAYYFLQALNTIDGPFFDASQVFERLRIPVGNNSGRVPRFDSISSIGDAGGQFIFVRK
jgi:hypothetical protein